MTADILVGDSLEQLKTLPMLSPLGLSNRKPLPLGVGYITTQINGK